MPIFDYECEECGLIQEKYVRTPDTLVFCICGGRTKKLPPSQYSVKVKYPRWVDRIDEHQKRQVDRGEKPTLPHPREVL